MDKRNLDKTESEVISEQIKEGQFKESSSRDVKSLLENLDKFVNLYFDDHGKKHLGDIK